MEVLVATPAFFHAHTGCLDANGKCHAFCYIATIRDADGSAISRYDTCPDSDNHPDGWAYPDADSD